MHRTLNFTTHIVGTVVDFRQRGKKLQRILIHGVMLSSLQLLIVQMTIITDCAENSR